MTVKLSEFLQFKNLHTEVKQQGECVVIFWYNNPPEPKEPFTIKKMWGDNYSINVNPKPEREILACALIYRPSANSYKVAMYAQSEKSGFCELNTFKNYDEIVLYIKNRIKVKQ